MQTQQIPIDQLRANDWNFNRMEREQFQELVAEIQHLGRPARPLIGRPKEAGFEIIDGEHNWRAAKEVGLSEVPVELIETDDFESMRQTYKRNQHGQHDRPALGRLFRRMMRERQLSARKLAEEISVSEGTIRNLVLYAELAERFEESVIRNVPTRHLRALKHLPKTIGK